MVTQTLALANNPTLELLSVYFVTSDSRLYDKILREYPGRIFEDPADRFSTGQGVNYIIYGCKFYPLRRFLCETLGDFELRDSKRGSLVMKRAGQELSLSE